MFTCPVMNIKISPSGWRICISAKPVLQNFLNFYLQIIIHSIIKEQKKVPVIIYIMNKNFTIEV